MTWRGRLVNFLTDDWVWPCVPHWLRVWAFLNDDMPDE